MDEDYFHRRYTAWAQRVHSLYGFFMCHIMETPSLSVEWIPESKRNLPSKGYSVAQIALGTYHTDQPNYLQVCSAFLPREWEEVIYEDTTFEEDVAFMHYPDSIAEAGNRLHPFKRVVHDGEVNVLKSCPQSPPVIATRGPHCQVHIFDISRRRSEPEDSVVRPDARLKGPKKEGFALSWSPVKAGRIASGGGDMIVYVWDIEEGPLAEFGKTSTMDIGVTLQLAGHTDTVESVSWHPTHDNVLASSGSDRHVLFWDIRSKKYSQKEECHAQAIYNVSFHPTGVFLLATASADHNVRIWDMRKMRKPLYELISHTSDVYGVQWSPFSDTLLASYSKDCSVILWDLSKTVMEPDPTLDHNAPPHMLFRHFGHTDVVRDVSWNPNEGDEWVMASVDDSNQCHIWQPAKSVYTEPDVMNVFANDRW
eukprot:PhF_6_TR16974/c0_g1_i1/m.25661/K10752/RBBP4, HAT2, CAF1, MIS16; histone-binding protein RBBP4